MLKRASISKLAVFSLLIGIFQTVLPGVGMGSAQAAGTVTKTVVVRDHSGNLMSGALVQMLTYDAVDEFYSPVVTTGANGVATFTISRYVNWMQLQVTPPSGNTTDAVAMADAGLSAVADGTYNINLKQANLKVELLNNDGTAAENHTWFCLPSVDPLLGTQNNGNCYWSLRSGAFGVYLPTALSTSTSYFATIAPDSRATNSATFAWRYGMKVSGAAGSQTPTFYSDAQFTSVYSPTGAGIYQFKLRTNTLVGHLKNTDGTSFTLPSGTHYNVRVVREDPSSGNPAADPQIARSNSGMTSNGTFYASVAGNIAGKYQVIFTPTGSGTNPAFVRNIYQDSSGNWSLTQSGYSATKPFEFNLSKPADSALLKLKVVKSGTSTLEAANIQVNRNSTKTDMGNIASTDGNASWEKSAFTDGTYSISLSPNRDDASNSNFTLTVSGSTFTLKDEANNVIALDGDGSYHVSLNSVNIPFVVSHPSGIELQTQWIDARMCIDLGGGNEGNCFWGNFNSATLQGGIQVPDGTYKLTLSPFGNSDLAAISYSVVVSGSSVVVKDASNTTIAKNSSGFYPLPIGLSSLKFKIVDPLDPSTMLTQSNIQVCPTDNSWNIQSCFDGGGWTGTSGVSLSTGKYLIRVNDQSGVYALSTYHLTYNATTSVATFQETVNKDGDVYLVSPKQPNLRLQIVDPANSSTPLTMGSVDYCPTSGGNCEGMGFNQQGKVNFNMPQGTYRLNVRPDSSLGFAMKTYEVTVNSAGVPSITGVTAESDGVFKLAPSVPNVTLTVKSPTGGAITFANGQWIQSTLFKWNSVKNSWDYSQDGGWSQGVVRYNITEAGRYRVSLNPIGFNDYSQSFIEPFDVTTGPLKVSYNSNSPADSQVINANLATPNLKLTVVNPLTSPATPLSNGWVTVEMFDDIYGARHWIQNMDLNASNAGLTSAALGNGQYLLTVNPPQGAASIVGLTTKQYIVKVEAGAVTSFTVGNDPQALGSAVSQDSGRYVVSPASANISGRVLDAAGVPWSNGNNIWMNVNLQKLAGDGVNWNWSNNWANVNQDGYFSMRVEAAGTYRLRLQPEGRSDVSVTNTDSFAVTDPNTLSKDFGEIRLNAPTLKVAVQTATGNTNLQNIGIEIRKNGNWIDWSGTGWSGIGGVNLTSAGTYDFVVNPPGDGSEPTASKKIYSVSVTASGSSFTGAVTGVTPNSSGVYVLKLGTAGLVGTVVDTTTPGVAVRDAQIVPVDNSTGQEMWDYSVGSHADGSWAMSLPQGSYSIYARAPWNVTNMGNSDLIGNVVVAANGNTSVEGAAQTAGLTTSAFKIKLKSPTWSGRVLDPTGATALANARVCLFVNISSKSPWICANTDQNGNWAMSAPTGYTVGTTDFASDSQLQVAPNGSSNFSMATYQGKSAIEGAGFMHGGGSVDLRLVAPNITIRVMANGSPARNLWVNLDKDNFGWIGGSGTDSNGYARFNLDGLSALPDKSFNVRVEVNGNADYSSSYASLFKRYTSSEVATLIGAGTTFADSVSLATPNVKMEVTDPVNNSLVPYTWVELFDATDNVWIGGGSTDRNGFVALNAPTAGHVYTVTVNAPWNGSTTSTRHAYTAVVDGSNTSIVALSDTFNAAPVSKNSSGIFPVHLATPSVTGVVQKPDGSSVANSWVNPINADTGDWLGNYGSNTNSQGQFGMALSPGNYQLEANVPWNVSGLARSARCSLTVTSSNTISNVSGCATNSGGVVLGLRAPNLTVRLVDKDGHPIQNAGFGIGLGPWNTYGNSDSNGKVSVFVDKAAIKSGFGGGLTGTQNLWIWIDPPWGSSAVVRVNCASSQVTTPCVNVPSVDLSTTSDYVGSDISSPITITMPAPNTTIQVKKPDDSNIGQGAWVQIFSVVGGNKQWIGGSNTDSSGVATFNIVDTSTAFAVQVDAPWNMKSQYAAKTYDGVSGAGLAFSSVNNQSFKLAAPNLNLVINAKSGVTDKWGWVNVEQVDISGNWIGWVGGYGLDDQGRASLSLPGTKYYRITAWPGPGKPGAQSVCYLQADSSDSVTVTTNASNTCTGANMVGSTLTMTLAQGNVIGTVTHNGTAVSGAVIYALPSTETSDNDAVAVITSTDSDGNYGLQLDSSIQWKIKVIPINPTGATDLMVLSGYNTAFTPPSPGQVAVRQNRTV